MITPDTAPIGTKVRREHDPKTFTIAEWIDTKGFRLKEEAGLIQYSAWLYSVIEQPAPQNSDKSVEVYAELMNHFAQRKVKGLEAYGTTLKTHNGRDALRDALDEATDLCMYLMQAIMERDAQCK